MTRVANLKIIDNSEVNRKLWNDCINSNPKNLIYGKSFYLDKVCPGWKAIIGTDYEWVVPVTFKRKYGIAYLYQPPFTQQLGVFSKPYVNIPYNAIISCLQKHYKFWEINWNYNTVFNLENRDLLISNATNFILDLSKSYVEIYGNYHKDLIKNLKRSKHLGLHYQPTEDYNQCIQLYQRYYGARISHVKNNDYENFASICDVASRDRSLICRQVLNNKNELLSQALLLKDKNRFYNLMNTTTETGRKASSNHFLIDSIIKEFSGQDLIFDFEGSDLPGVKNFYENFGATNQPYYTLKYNQLPWPFNKLKN